MVVQEERPEALLINPKWLSLLCLALLVEERCRASSATNCYI